MKSLAIQIVNYKTKKHLIPLLESLFKDVRDLDIKFEVNILDNDSGDNLQDIEHKWRDHNLNIYYSDRNGGFGYGHNILAGKTKAKYLLILNPDILFIEDGTIKRLLESFERTKATVLGPRLLNMQGNNLIQQPRDHNVSIKTFGGYKIHDDITKVAWVAGAVFLIERQSFLDICGFDEKYFLYYEELDLCKRLRAKGGVIIYDPTIRVYHYRRAVASKKTLYHFKSLIRYAIKNWKNTI